MTVPVRCAPRGSGVRSRPLRRGESDSRSPCGAVKGTIRRRRPARSCGRRIRGRRPKSLRFRRDEGSPHLRASRVGRSAFMAGGRVASRTRRDSRTRRCSFTVPFRRPNHWSRGAIRERARPSRGRLRDRTPPAPPFGSPVEFARSERGPEAPDGPVRLGGQASTHSGVVERRRATLRPSWATAVYNTTGEPVELIPTLMGLRLRLLGKAVILEVIPGQVARSPRCSRCAARATASPARRGWYRGWRPGRRLEGH